MNKGRDRDKRAHGRLRFWARVFMTVGRTATFMPRAEIAADWDLSAGSTIKVPVKSAYSLATPRAVGAWPSWASILSEGPLRDFTHTMGQTAKTFHLWE